MSINVKQIFAENSHTIALCHDGSILSCGNNDGGSLNFDGKTSAKKMFCGPNHTVLVTSDNVAYGTNPVTRELVKLPLDGDELEYAAFGVNHYLVLTKNGTVLQFGKAAEGYCHVHQLENIVDICCTMEAICAIDSLGNLHLSRGGEITTFAFGAYGSLIGYYKSAIGVKINGDVTYINESNALDVNVWNLFQSRANNGEAEAITKISPHKAGIAWDHKQSTAIYRTVFPVAFTILRVSCTTA